MKLFIMPIRGLTPHPHLIFSLFYPLSHTRSPFSLFLSSAKIAQGRSTLSATKGPTCVDVVRRRGLKTLSLVWNCVFNGGIFGIFKKIRVSSKFFETFYNSHQGLDTSPPPHLFFILPSFSHSISLLSLSF